MWNFNVKASFWVFFLIERFIYEIIKGKKGLSLQPEHDCVNLIWNNLIYRWLFYSSIKMLDSLNSVFV